MASSSQSYVRRVVEYTRRIVVRTVVAVTATTAALEVTTHLPSQGRSSEFYHKLSDDYVTPLLRKLDPETAHNVAIALASKGLAPKHHPSAVEQQCNMQMELHFPPRTTSSNNKNVRRPQQIQIKPLVTPNGIGLAAGFDKDGCIVAPMLELGFGLVEIGTVTLQPQPGNKPPRMFRLLPDRAIINRYGFNSAGANVVATNLRNYYYYNESLLTKEEQHEESKDSRREKQNHWLWNAVWGVLYPVRTPRSSPVVVRGAVGINIGKNKDSVDGVADYTRLIAQLGPLADYLVLNVSSPNTTNLRTEWQNNLDNLQTLLTACIQARNNLIDDSSSGSSSSSSDTNTVPPLFVKLAPDLTDDELIKIANICLQTGIDGIVVTNTTSTRPAQLISEQTLQEQAGGLSGRPVKDMSTTIIRKLYAATNGALPIIGVGGVSTAADAYEKFRAGASLVQIYSVLVYEGPGVVSRMRHDLASILLQNGYHNLQDVVGLDHDDIYWQKRQARLQLQQKLDQQEYDSQQQELEDAVAAASTATTTTNNSSAE